MKNNSIIFLVDGPDKGWIRVGFEKIGRKIMVLEINNTNFVFTNRFTRILKLHWGYIRQAFHANRISKNDDLIICWLDISALYSLILNGFFNKKLNIIAINIMFNYSNKDLISKIKFKLFKWMLNKKNVTPTFTSKKLGEVYKELFDLNQKKYYLLNDCYGNECHYKNAIVNNDRYVFCGGKNGRDWKTILKVASKLPEIKFKIVVPNRSVIPKKYSKNIAIYSNISQDKFKELMANSSLVALPLCTDAPAGLIVIYTAGLLRKPVITTKTSTTIEYINNYKNGILINKEDVDSFSRELKTLFLDLNLQLNLGQELNKSVEKVGSVENYIHNLDNIILQVNTF